MEKCPSCGEDIEVEGAPCPRCRQEEPTESFSPVDAGEKELTEEQLAAAELLLVVHKGPEVGERFYIDRPRLTIGRDPESDIFLNDITVSREHAQLSYTGESVTVRDAGSLNGTYVNGIRVEEAVLRAGDVLQIGRFQMALLGGER